MGTHHSSLDDSSLDEFSRKNDLNKNNKSKTSSEASSAKSRDRRILTDPLASPFSNFFSNSFASKKTSKKLGEKEASDYDEFSDKKNKKLNNKKSCLLDSDYSFADLLAVFFSYLFFYITSNYLSKVELTQTYKHNGLVALSVVVLIVNSYYLLKPIYQKYLNSTLGVLDKISLAPILAIIISGLYATFQIATKSVSVPFSSIFLNFFFWGTIVFIFENICFTAGLKKVKESLNIEKDYLLDDYVYITSTDNLQSATVQKKLLKDLRRGDLVYVKIGDTLPFDGEVVDGEAIVSKRIYAGEAEADMLTKKLYAFGGSKILNGELIIKVDNLWEDTFIYDNISKCQNAICEKQQILNKKVYFYFFLACLISFAINFLFISKISFESILLYLVSCLVLFSFLKVFILKNAFSKFLLKEAFSSNILITKRSLLDKFLTLKNYIFDFSDGVFSKDFRVNKFRLYDERIDEAYLLEALFSIFAKSDNPLLKKLNTFIAKKQEIIKAYKIEDYVEYSDYNVVALLAGARFVIGEESFMIEMKVQAQESDFMPEEEESKKIYVALNDVVIGYFDLKEEFTLALEKLVKDVSEQGDNFYLVSTETEDRVEELGKRAGIGLANIFGGLTIKSYFDKLDAIGEGLFFSNLQTDRQVMRKVRHNIGVFDPLICETDNLSVVIFGDNLLSFEKIVSYIKSYKKFLNHFFIYLVISLLVFIALSFNPIFLMVAVSAFSIIFLSLFRCRVDKF
ncbi:MAG: hypothetical protein ACOX3T_03230 [Bdellovibrionota bacterium]